MMPCRRQAFGDGKEDGKVWAVAERVQRVLTDGLLTGVPANRFFEGGASLSAAPKALWEIGRKSSECAR